MNKLWDLIDKYNETFENAFPTIPLADDPKAIEILEDCLKQNKDVYELGYLENDPDILY